ncbi:hypothetical protein F5876DRAFT_51804 [Lentinula aff. lateritia]|uniref:Uncharacterized protein n=1 Tax=Lentinula aff. lateritia TaxID=2804960 RepID=A0ACC1TL86_9AGAR|nr:hypothetical protein F5876DRAFT_51804 [Lentinula aff. lateritia]
MTALTDPFASHYTPSFKRSSTTTLTHGNRARHNDYSNTSRVHRASLVDASEHSPALLELIDVDLSAHLIDHVVDCVTDVIDFIMRRRRPLSRSKTAERRIALQHLRIFVKMLLARSGVRTPVVLAALVYIDRAKYRLQSIMSGLEFPLEQIFLGALTTASKYLNDHTIKNFHWEVSTLIFSAREIGEFELVFLGCLRWNLRLSEEDIMVHYASMCTDVDPYFAHAQYFRVSTRRQKRYQSTQLDTLDDSAELDSLASDSSGDISLLYIPSSRKTPLKLKLPLRKWFQSFRRSRKTIS